MKYTQVFIGLGSNLGDRRAYLHQSIRKLQGNPECRIRQQSPVYETEPRYVAANPSYLNQVIHLEANLEPEELLQETQ